MKVIINESQVKLLNESFDASKWNISTEGIRFILEFEKFNPRAYKDGVINGVQRYSIGYGHQINSNDSKENVKRWFKNGISRKEATELFRVDLQLHIADLTRSIYRKMKDFYIDGSVYPQGFKDAVISMIYNMGHGVFLNSTFFKTWVSMANPVNNSSPRIFSVKNGRKTINVGNYNLLIKTILSAALTVKGSNEQSSGLMERRKGEFMMANVFHS